MKWKLRPKDIFTLRYWLHLGILSLVTFIILQLLFKGEMLTIKNVLVSIPILGASDVIAHTITGID